MAPPPDNLSRIEHYEAGQRDRINVGLSNPEQGLFQIAHWNIQGKGKPGKFDTISKILRSINPTVISFN